MSSARSAGVIVAETGEERLGFLARDETDKRLLKERGMRSGLECRAEFKMSRNVKFHRLAHVIGHLLVDNVEEFRGKGAHDALKAVQLASNTACDMIEMDATPVISAILDACESLLGKGARKVLAASCRSGITIVRLPATNTSRPTPASARCW